MRTCRVWKFACRTVAIAPTGSGIFAAVMLAAGMGTSLLPPGPAAARSPSGPAHGVVAGHARVVDGDTLQVGPSRVRLEGIDAPETSQTCVDGAGAIWNCGNVAAAELEKLVRHQVVSCDASGLDKYGRTLAVCYVGELDLNAEMVRRGLAWAFVRYSQRYVADEQAARQRHVGIWAGDAQPAWAWREQQWTAALSEAPAGCAIKGNHGRNGAIYHTPWSPWYAKVRMEGSGKRWFCSEAEASAAGFRPALWR